MCWSKDVSLGLSIFGMVFTYISYKFIDFYWAINIFYFTIMQVIHYLGYLVIDDCNNPFNKQISYANYIHVSFQPFVFLLGFYGLFKKYRILDKQQIYLLKNICIIAFIVSILLFIRIFPLNLTKNYKYDLETNDCFLCGKTCTFSGKQHINFSLPLRKTPEYLTPSIFTHFLFWYIPFLFLFNNVTRVIGTVIFISAIIPALLYNLAPEEASTIWCSIYLFQCVLTILILFLHKKLKF